MKTDSIYKDIALIMLAAIIIAVGMCAIVILANGTKYLVNEIQSKHQTEICNDNN